MHFLLQRTGQADEEAAAVIAHTLGRLPLALEQAAAYMEANGRELVSYAGLLRIRLLDLMEHGKPEDYPRPVATTWQLSFERIEDEHPPAAALLRFCAFMAPDDIPADQLQSVVDTLPPELQDALVDALEFDRTIAALRRYSLIERQGDGLRVHQLVQAAVRKSLGEGQRKLWLGAVIRFLVAAFPEEPNEKPELWPLCARLLPHAEVAGQQAADEFIEPELLCRLLDQVAKYLWARDRQGGLALAQPLLERALAIGERVLGPDDPDNVPRLNHLGWVLRDQGDYDAARRLLERSFAIAEQLPDSAISAESYDHFGWLLHDMGDLATAQRLLERGLAIRERVLGPDHPLTARSLRHVAVVLGEQGELVAARQLIGRALAIRERVQGPHHPGTARSLHSLALLLRDQGDLALARLVIEQAVTTLESVLGPQHRWSIESRTVLDDMICDQEPSQEPVDRR